MPCWKEKWDLQIISLSYAKAGIVFELKSSDFIQVKQNRFIVKQ